MARKRRQQVVLPSLDAVKYEMIDGKVVVTKVGRCHPIPEQKVWAEHFLPVINRELWKDGSWRIVFTNPVDSYWDRPSGIFRVGVPELIELQFIDKDGDVQFVVDIEEHADDLIDTPFTHWMTQCEQAYKQWYDHIRLVEVTPEQMIMASKGQQSINPNIQAPQ